MTIYLVRHAKAGDRSQWRGDDWLRPLTSAGHAQSRALVDTFKGATFTRLVSSPYVRCLDTLTPIAGHHLLPVEPADALAEGADLDATMALVADLLDGGAVLCSHGDVIPDILGRLVATGTTLLSDLRCEKASTWVLESEQDRIVTARHLPPPVV